MKSVSPEAVLDRPLLTKFDPVLTGELRVDFVTGAGGSIGMSYASSYLVMIQITHTIDSSEFALYLLEENL